MGLKESGLRGSLRNVSVGIDAIPDTKNLHAEYAAFDLGLNDGEAVETWRDSFADNDLTGSGDVPTFNANEINGEPAVEFSTDDLLTVSFDPLPQPNTIYLVIKPDTPRSSDAFLDSLDESFQHQFQNQNDEYSLQNELDGDPPSGGYDLIVGRFDTGNSLIRVNQSDVTGTISDESLEGLEVGAPNGDWSGNIAHILPYTTSHDTSTIENVESYLNGFYDTLS